MKYWGPASPTHKLPPSFAGNKDGEGWGPWTPAPRSPSGEGRARGAVGRGGAGLSRPAPAELMQHMDEVNDELAKKISNIRAQPARPFRVERSQPAAPPLTHASGPREVRAWLEAKAFSTR